VNVDSGDSLNQLLIQAGVGAGSEIARRLSIYLALLEKWNSRVNLTASTEWSRIKPMLEEAVRAARFYPKEAVEHLDIGSGAGFPALAMRIIVPKIRLEMVESRTKRAAFLETVVRELALDRTIVVNCRLDEYLHARERVWDCISWKGIRLKTRDLRELQALVGWNTQFWMFHGRELAVEDPEAVKKGFQLVRREKLLDGKEWTLSIYRKRFT